MNTQTQTGIDSGRGSRRMHVGLALATAVAGIAFLAFSNETPTGADASQPRMNQQVVGQARAAGNDAVQAQSWNGIPAASATATEGNVVDLTY